ncbi:hypothetical protein KFL_001130070 [Klebsormidium nitens]|uniref:Uncharacterized protein n=1 Tax=Klebsormidium nitens TaxID=105231 RepID=A0A0U9HJJ3_KLENI|nr:hypothetical protein KFL_001130070 [Klebsormidium nitens]|eukprot:GAQ82488.1 hypothetical protein KFL_001130070 [Klebsormidium nitens]
MAKEAEQDDPSPSSISSVLTLPVDIVVRRVRNVREAELLLQVSSTASNFESAVSVYEVLALKIEELKEGWDALWLSDEAFLNPGIPLVGQAMSQQNAARGHVIQQIEDLVATLQQQATALVQFADMHRSYARELSAEGLGKLAAEKLLLCDIEQELSARITRICGGGGLAGLRPLCDVVQQMKASLLTSPKPNPRPAERTGAEERRSGVEPGGHAVGLTAVGTERDGFAGETVERETGTETEKAGIRGRNELLVDGVERMSRGEEAGIAVREETQEDNAMEQAENESTPVGVAEKPVGLSDELHAEKAGAGSRNGLAEKGTDETDRLELGVGSRKRLREDDAEGKREQEQLSLGIEKSGLSKRLRGNDVGAGYEDDPRIGAGAGQASPGRRAEHPIGDGQITGTLEQELTRPGPFSPNLAASFQLEERPEGEAPEQERPEEEKMEQENAETKGSEEERPEGDRPGEKRAGRGRSEEERPEVRPEGKRPEEERPEDRPEGKRLEEERPEEERLEANGPEEEWPDESGSKEAPGSDEIDWGKVRNRRGGSQGDASAPAASAEEGSRGAESGDERLGSETEQRREQDASISSRERQLLTDEKLTPGSSSVSRGMFHATQSPPSSGKGAGDTPPSSGKTPKNTPLSSGKRFGNPSPGSEEGLGNIPPASSPVPQGSLRFTQSPSKKVPGDSPLGSSGGLAGVDERSLTGRGTFQRKLDGFVTLDGGLQRRSYPTTVVIGPRAMQPPNILPTSHHASAEFSFDREAGEGPDPRSGLEKEERTLESSSHQDPVKSGQVASQEATPPEHSPGSQTQSLFQSQAEQAGSQRTPGSKLSPGKSGGNDGHHGSPPSNLAFQLRLSGSSSSPSKSPGSEKLSQTGGGLLFENGLRKQSRVMAHSESGRAVLEGGTTELEAGTETLNQGLGALGVELRSQSERASWRIATFSQSGGSLLEGGTTELEGGSGRTEGEVARVAGETVELAGGTAGGPEDGKGVWEGGTAQVESGIAGLQSKSMAAEGGSAEIEDGMTERERGITEMPSFAADGAARAASAEHNLLFETRHAHVGRGLELTEGFVSRALNNGDRPAVEKSGGPEALRTGERISGALSRGRNVTAERKTHDFDEDAANAGKKEGALSLAVAANKRPPSYAGVRACEPEWRETASAARGKPSNQSHSLPGGKAQADAVCTAAVPDSEEGGSQSSGRGVDPGATPPPSSKSCSRDDLPERGGELLPKEGTSTGADRLMYNRASAAVGIGREANSGDGAETASESGETELVPETEETEEETEEQGCGQEKASLGREPALTASPCRASESPGMSGSQPLSQSQVF